MLPVNKRQKRITRLLQGMVFGATVKRSRAGILQERLIIGGKIQTGINLMA